MSHVWVYGSRGGSHHTLGSVWGMESSIFYDLVRKDTTDDNVSVHDVPVLEISALYCAHPGSIHCTKLDL